MRELFMKNPKTLVDCCIITVTAYLAVPIIGIPFMLSGSFTFTTVSLFAIFPLLCLSCGVVCGRKNGLQLFYPALAGVLFLPSLFLFYDTSIWSFVIIYIFTAFIGVAIGSFIQKNNSGRRSNGRLK